MNRVTTDFRNEMRGLRSYFGHVACHLQKDLRLEWRSRDSVVGMLFFALLVVIIFSLAFDPTAAVSRQIAGGILWVALLFASFTALNQSWTREQRNRVLDAQRMSPAPASALFLGKALANLLFVALIEVVLAPLFIIFYNLHALGDGWMLAIVMPLGTWALVCNGTFFAALGLRTRNRELMLPLIMVPISLPALLGMMQATTAILTGESDPTIWIRLLVAYNIAFTTVCLLLFETVLSAE
jgi:heme exporter protein B